MTDTEILEYNKRCAEFLGWKNKGMINLELWISTERQQGIMTSDLKFHSDWNWIMEVCIKLGMEFVITNKEQLILNIYDKLRSMETNT